MLSEDEAGLPEVGSFLPSLDDALSGMVLFQECMSNTDDTEMGPESSAESLEQPSEEGSAPPQALTIRACPGRASIEAFSSHGARDAFSGFQEFRCVNLKTPFRGGGRRLFFLPWRMPLTRYQVR